MKKHNIIYLFITAILFSSCNEFLSDRPSKTSGVIPTTMDDVEMILAGAWRSDCISDHAIYATGDIEVVSELESIRTGSYTVQNIQFATWERDMTATYKDYLWMYRYQNIFRSNLADQVLAANEFTEEEKVYAYAKSAFRRAYSYMELLNVYTLPYCEDNLDELGLPLTRQTGFNYDISRSSLKDTYDFVEQDILSALKLDIQLNPNSYGHGSFYRVSTASANALAARFYLMKHDYENANKYAKVALQEYGTDMIMDYNSVGYHTTVQTVNYDKDGDGEEEELEIKYPYTYSGYNMINWTESYFLGYVESAFASGFSNDCLVSNDYIAVFDEDGDKEYDARYKYFYVENYTYLQGRNVDRLYYMKPDAYYITVPEILLIAAECEARVGDFNTAISYVNELRSKRIDPSSPNINLTASSKDEAIMMVIREKKREVGPHKQLFDYRRYNSNDYTADDITIKKHFYEYSSSAIDASSELVEYVLEPKDRRWAAMIPSSDIASSKGAIKQNTY